MMWYALLDYLVLYLHVRLVTKITINSPLSESFDELFDGLWRELFRVPGQVSLVRNIYLWGKLVIQLFHPYSVNILALTGLSSRVKSEIYIFSLANLHSAVVGHFSVLLGYSLSFDKGVKGSFPFLPTCSNICRVSVAIKWRNYS